MSEPSRITEAGFQADVERAERAMSEFGVLTATRTIRLERVLPGPVERVWAYLTESEKRGTWLAAGPMELHVGGRVELSFRNSELTSHAETPPEKYRKHEGGVEVRGRVTRCEPPRLLSYTWRDDSEVTFELSPRDDKVVLVVTHRRLPDRATMVSVASGWHTHLGILVDRMNEREPQPFWSTYVRLEAEYERQLPAE
jgi:uncharacterized protein YndB with AHSA1/START domain